MPLFFEHKSIRRTLDLLELKEELRKVEAISDETEPVCIGWSSREALMLRPEYSCLSSREIEYLRLPQPLETLREIIHKATNPWETTKALSLQTPLGQWQLALENLKAALDQGEREEAGLRLTELRRFCSKHWPGYYETSLSALLVASADANERIESLQSNAISVALLVACHPVMSWIEDPARANQIVTLRDLAAYSEQGIFDTSEIRQFAAELGWISEFESDVSATEQSLKSIWRAGSEPDIVLKDLIELIQNTLSEVRRLVDELPKLDRLGLHKLRAELDVLTRTIGDITKLRSRLRATLISSGRDS